MPLITTLALQAGNRFASDCYSQMQGNPMIWGAFPWSSYPWALLPINLYRQLPIYLPDKGAFWILTWHYSTHSLMWFGQCLITKLRVWTVAYFVLFMTICEEDALGTFAVWELHRTVGWVLVYLGNTEVQILWAQCPLVSFFLFS